VHPTLREPAPVVPRPPAPSAQRQGGTLPVPPRAEPLMQPQGNQRPRSLTRIPRGGVPRLVCASPRSRVGRGGLENSSRSGSPPKYGFGVRTSTPPRLKTSGNDRSALLNEGLGDTSTLVGKFREAAAEGKYDRRMSKLNSCIQWRSATGSSQASRRQRRESEQRVTSRAEITKLRSTPSGDDHQPYYQEKLPNVTSYHPAKSAGREG